MKAAIFSLGTGDPTRSIPLAGASIAAYCAASGQTVPALLEATEGQDADEEAAKFAGFDIAGFSVYSWNEAECAKLAAAARNRHPDLITVAGGPVATGNPSATLDSGAYDIVVAGEGERAFVSILKACESGKTRKERVSSVSSENIQGVYTAGKKPGGDPVVQTSPLAPDSLASPWLSGILIPERDGSVLWETARGCPWRCAYCFESKGQKTVRVLPQERITKELDLFNRKGVSQIHVLDPAFNANPARADTLLKAIAKHAPDCFYAFEARAETMTQETAELLSRIHCSVQIGLQSSNPKALQAIDRQFSRGAFERGIGYLNECGIVFGFDLIYGLPGDTLADFRKSVDYAISLWPNHLDIFPLEVIPGTKLADERKNLRLETTPGPRFKVTSHPEFSETDMAMAERIAEGARALYCRGKAVPWFNQFLHAVGKSASAVFAEFEKACAAPGIHPETSDETEYRNTLYGYLRETLAKAGIEKASALQADIVTMSFAFADAVTRDRKPGTLVGGLSLVDLGYRTEDLMDAGAQDLKLVLKTLEPSRTKAVVWPLAREIACEPVSGEFWDWLKLAAEGMAKADRKFEKRAREFGMLE